MEYFNSRACSTVVIGIWLEIQMPLVQIPLGVLNVLCSLTRHFNHIFSVHTTKNGYQHMLGINMR